MAVSLAKEADSRREELLQERRIPQDLFQRAGEANLFRQMLCKELGGLGRSPAEWFETGVEMARWEPSFAWVVNQGSGDLATFVAAGDAAFAKAFLADQGAYTASSDNGLGTLVKDGEGYRVEGRWGFCSGCQGATWVGGFARSPDETVDGNPAEAKWALVPAARARIEETWDTIGMVGTGSHSAVLESQQIPRNWTFIVEQPGPNDYGPMSAAAGNGYWPISTAVSAVQLGIARRTLDAAAELVKKKPDARRKTRLAENTHVQRELMRAEATWFANKAAVSVALQQMWDAAQHDRKIPASILLTLASANVLAAAAAIDIVDVVCDIVGTSVAPARSLFAACLKDARTMGSHLSVNPAKFELIAQIRLGMVDGDQPF
jgi:alkylation response protein AidB-like acyl-CoA dehydrogenase